MRAMRAVPIQHSAPHSNEVSRVRAQVPAPRGRRKQERLRPETIDAGAEFLDAQFCEGPRLTLGWMAETTPRAIQTLDDLFTCNRSIKNAAQHAAREREALCSRRLILV